MDLFLNELISYEVIQYFHCEMEHENHKLCILLSFLFCIYQNNLVIFFCLLNFNRSFVEKTQGILNFKVHHELLSMSNNNVLLQIDFWSPYVDCH